MDVNNTNSVLEEQFDDVKNNTENAVEAADNATETVNENESEKVIDEPEVAVEVADDAPEIVNENESEETIDEPEVAVEVADDAPEIVNEIESEILIDETEIDIILSEKLTDEDDDISLQKADDEIIDFSIEEAFIAAESEEFDLEDDEEIDLDSDEDTEVSSNFSEMNKAELNVAFRNILETQPVEKIRKDVDAVKTSFYKILRQEQDVYRQEYIAKGNDIESYIAPVDKYEIEFKSLFNSYKVKRSAYLRNLENNKEDNYKIKLKLIDELKELIDKKENINHTFQAFKELQKRWRETGPIPQSYMKDLWDTYNHHVENFYDYLKINKELRDMDLKKNLEAKIQLCEKAEELLIEPSVVTAFRKLQKYHEQWREIGPVANELKEQIWERFKEATSKINKKHQEYFEQQKGLQEQNLKAKLVLCEKIEELVAAQTKTNKEWNKSSKILIEMQKAWKSIGFASKKDNGKIYLRFRKACDEFFTKKRKFYSEFKKSMDGNLHLKLDLCKQAEALSENTDWKKTTEQLIKLQKEWKEIGVVPRKVSAEVWKRFRTACDKFFNSRNSVLKEQDTRYDENLKAKQAIIKEVKEYEAGRDVVRNLDALKDFQRRWAAIGFVPIKYKTQIQTEFRTLVDNLFKSLNISETDRKIVKFRTQLKNTQTGGGGKGQTKTLRSERDKLLGQIRQIEADIALWENNIGFFAKSKNADTFVSEVKRKIEKSKEEVIVLEEKIKLLDQTI
ncbi:MAG: DUF349 domain-containing protein [Prevotellaceae bacterium]|jgi:hypothetical protein|nr:DUF349 domain-containing protein [Prevotellaceae bacterium]